MIDYLALFNFEFLGNTGKEYIISLAAFIVLTLLLKIFQVILIAKLKKAAEHTKTDVDDVFVRIISNVKPPFYSFISLYVALKILNLNDIFEKVLDGLFILLVVYQVINSLQHLSKLYVLVLYHKSSNDIPSINV